MRHGQYTRVRIAFKNAQRLAGQRPGRVMPHSVQSCRLRAELSFGCEGKLEIGVTIPQSVLYRADKVIKLRQQQKIMIAEGRKPWKQSEQRGGPFR